MSTVDDGWNAEFSRWRLSELARLNMILQGHGVPEDNRPIIGVIMDTVRAAKEAQRVELTLRERTRLNFVKYRRPDATPRRERPLYFIVDCE